MLSLLILAMAADQPLPGEQPLPDAVLAEQRGGFRLPSGLDIDLAVRTQTAVDGKVVLATVFTLAEGGSRFTAYVPRPGETVSAAPTAKAGANAGSVALPQIAFDGRNGISVIPGQAASNVAVGGGSGAGTLSDGLVEVSPGEVAGGTLGAVTDGTLRKIQLDAADLSIAHLAGRAFGSVIANSASDRAIDTTTSVGIDLRNAGPDNLGSTFLQVGDLSADAIARRIN